jgi:hypothetical protein
MSPTDPPQDPQLGIPWIPDEVGQQTAEGPGSATAPGDPPP